MKQIIKVWTDWVPPGVTWIEPGRIYSARNNQGALYELLGEDGESLGVQILVPGLCAHLNYGVPEVDRQWRIVE